MAHTYTLVNFTLPFKGAQADRILALASCIEEILVYGEYEEKYLREQGFDEEIIQTAIRAVCAEDSWGVEVSKNSEGLVWVYGPEDACVDTVISFVEAALSMMDSPEIVSFEWVDTTKDERRSVGESSAAASCNGGAVAISKDGHESLVAELWLGEAAKKLKAA